MTVQEASEREDLSVSVRNILKHFDFEKQIQSIDDLDFLSIRCAGHERLKEFKRFKLNNCGYNKTARQSEITQIHFEFHKDKLVMLEVNGALTESAKSTMKKQIEKLITVN